MADSGEVPILLVAGARPNFMKVAPIKWALQRAGVRSALVHTGQHYDQDMSDVFFRDLELPKPDVHLEIGSGLHGEQTAKVLMAIEKVLIRMQPGLVVVVGDVNSTLAATLAAVKLNISVAHVEAGLRSFDRSMPEEINRVLVDRVADLLFTPSPDADSNLLHEGIAQSRIHLVGNVMIDTLFRLLPKARTLGIPRQLGLTPKQYVVCTLHRAATVDSPERLCSALQAIVRVADEMPVVLPLHPRTKARLQDFNLEETVRQASRQGLVMTKPMGYLEFMGLMAEAGMVMTDSGGLQEEATALGIPCLTMRENTERPITVSMGSNRLVGNDPDTIVEAAKEVIRNLRLDPLWPSQEPGPVRGGDDDTEERVHLPLWDGHAAERVVGVMVSHL